MPFRDARIDRPDRHRPTATPARRTVGRERPRITMRMMMLFAAGGVGLLLAGVAVGILLSRLTDRLPDGGMGPAVFHPAEELPVGPPVAQAEPAVVLPLEDDERPRVFGLKGEVGMVTLFAHRAAMEDYFALARHNLDRDIDRMERDGALWYVAAGTPGAIRDERETEATVRVLSGLHAGRKGVLPTAWYHIPKE
jgi:hypothetical protein